MYTFIFIRCSTTSVVLHIITGIIGLLNLKSPERSDQEFVQKFKSVSVSNLVITPKSAIPYRNGILVLSYTRECGMKCGTLSTLQYVVYKCTPQYT